MPQHRLNKSFSRLQRFRQRVQDALANGFLVSEKRSTVIFLIKRIGGIDRNGSADFHEITIKLIKQRFLLTVSGEILIRTVSAQKNVVAQFPRPLAKPVHRRTAPPSGGKSRGGYKGNQTR